MTKFGSLIFAASALAMTGAHAGEVEMSWAVENGCLAGYPLFDSVPYGLESQGWNKVQGAEPNEFELAKGDVTVFVAYGAPSENPGCTVVSESVSATDAARIVETMLDRHFPGDWRKESGWGGAPAWRVRNAGPFLEIYVHEGVTGEGGPGSGISHQVRAQE